MLSGVTMKAMLKTDDIPDELSPRYHSNSYEPFTVRNTYQYQDEPYRCPVSTPTATRRPSIQPRNQNLPYPPSTNFSRTILIPKHISSMKQADNRSSLDWRPAKPQKKNFDFYFTSKGDKSVTIDAQTQSTWLSALCSQPVDEILGKYKRKTETMYLRTHTSKNPNTTPGERALISAWSTFTSNRISSVMSRSSRSVNLTTERSSHGSGVDLNLRVHGFDSDPDRIMMHTSFALIPMPAINKDIDENSLSSGSPLSHKVFSKNNEESVKYIGGEYGFKNSSTYEPYQRDKRFPDIRQRKTTLSPTRKRIYSEQKEILSTTCVKQDLHESPMQIISIGQDAENKQDYERELVSRDSIQQ